MEEQEKPFDTVSIVILVMLALGNDGAEIFFDLLAATVIGLPGEAIMEPINLGMDGIFTFWFFAKCGFGGPSIIQVADDLLELVGIPGRTICVVAGILIANNPKLAAVAEMAGAGALTGGAGAVATEAGEAGAAAEGAATAAKGTEAAAKAESGVEAGVPKTAGETGGETEKPQEKGATTEEEMETREERSPEENAQEEIFEQVAQNQNDTEEEEEDKDNQVEQSNSNVISIDQGRKNGTVSNIDSNNEERAINAKVIEIRRQQEKPQAPKIIDLREEDKAA
jgi:hypothetical protein